MPMFMQTVQDTILPLNYASQQTFPIRPFFPPPEKQPTLCRGLDLRQGLPLLEAALLLESHNLESIEVCQRLPSLLLEALLGPVALLPLRVDAGLVPRRLDGCCARTPR